MASSKKKNTDLTTVPEKKPEPKAPEKKKSKLPVILAILIMIVAIALAIGIYLRNQSIQEEINQLTEDLSASQDRWQTISEEKEALQEELSQVQSDIREAQLVIQESNLKVEDLMVQIASLTDLNDTLDLQLKASTTRARNIQSALATLSETEVMLNNASAVILDQMDNRGGASTGGLWASLVMARQSLLDVWKSERKALKEDASLLQTELDALPAEGFEEKADMIRSTIESLQAQIEALSSKILEYDSSLE